MLGKNKVVLFGLMLFVLIWFAACSQTTATSESEAGTVNAATEIIPPPLPTTLPDQQAQLDEAAQNKVNSVDFAIDTTLLEASSIPFRFKNGDNVYKYSSPNGAYSVLLYGSDRPAGIGGIGGGFPANVFGNAVEYFGVEASDFTGLVSNNVWYYTDPSLTKGEQTPEQYLALFADSPVGGVIGILGMASATVVEQHEIQLQGFPGRDFILEVSPNAGGNASFDARLRVFVVEDMVYQLFASNKSGGTLDDSETSVWFLDSFTLNN